MTFLTSALDTVTAALATQQVGTPVAARMVAHVTPDHGHIAHLSALCLAAASEWLGSSASSISAVGGAKHGQVTTLASYKNGQTALVSVGSSGMGPPTLEISIVGSQGILTWDNARDLHVATPMADGDEKLSPAARQFQAAVAKSLETGQMVRISDSGTATPIDSAKRSAKVKPPRNVQARKKKRGPFGVLLVAGDHSHQPGYSAALAADKRCKVIGVTDERDITPERKQLNEQFAKRTGFKLLPDLDEALARDDVDIVSICAEPIRRGRIIVAAAKAGKHLYLDKPLAGSLADADAIVQATEVSGGVSHMFTQIHWPAARRLQQLVRDGVLGKLTAIHCDLYFAKGHPGTAKLGKPRRESAAPNRYEWLDAKRELTNVGVYPIAMMLWLLGKNARSVSATTGNYFFAEHQKRDAEDFGQMVIGFDGGVTASISVGRAGWRSHPAGGFHRTYLIGSERTAVVDASHPHVEVWADVDGWKPPRRNPDDPMGMWGVPSEGPYSPAPKQSWITPPVPRSADVDHFLDCIEQGRESEIPARLSAAATEILLAGYRSAADGGGIVEIPLPRS